MNNAKKVREMQEIYFEESRENEMNKNNLKILSKKYDCLEVLCKELIESFDSECNISLQVEKIKEFLKENQTIS